LHSGGDGARRPGWGTRLFMIASCLVATAGLLSCGGPREDMSELAPHVLADVENPEQVGPHPSVYLFIVVPANISEREVKAIAAAYEKRFSRADILNIDFHCDATFANQKYLYTHTVTDQLYYSHVLYSVMKGGGRVMWYKPGEGGRGSACSPGGG